MAVEHVPVLIVGAGVTGLTASLFLAEHGVRSLLVERHGGTSIYPRARGVNGRTMELMRELGLESPIREAGTRLAPAVGIYAGRTLVETLEANGEGGWFMKRLRARGMRGQGSKKSPTGACRCTQDELEPILLDAARACGVDARFATELTSFEQHAEGVSATLVDRSTGASREVGADYLIAADGARSPIREKLGVQRSGERLQGHQLNVFFRADLGALVRGREFSLCVVDNPDVRGLFASIDNREQWVLHVSYDPAKSERPEDFSRERCAELVRKAVGIEDLAVEVKGISPWQSAVRVADVFRRDRVFLAGDAAHAMPPWGGFGANTGMQDAHNLAWKLAAVLSGHAGAALLDTYDVERRPVAHTVSHLAGELSDERGLIRVEKGLAMFWAMRKIFPYLTMGYGYASSAVALEPGALPGPGFTELRGRPGTRAPHVWLGQGGRRISTLDLFGKGFVLLAGSRGAASWRDAARAAAEALGVRVDAYDVGGELGDPRRRWSSANGVSAGGAVLVRPDGIVAWRSRRAAASPADALVKVLRGVLSRPIEEPAIRAA